MLTLVNSIQKHIGWLMRQSATLVETELSQQLLISMKFGAGIHVPIV